MVKFGLNLFAALASAAFLSIATPSLASTPAKNEPVVYVVIDVSSQVMRVEVNGRRYSKWKVSTAGKGYHTPRGSYSVQRMAKEYYSQKYDMAPMPYSVFFNGGYAVHGSNHIKSLGRPASHGCVRLHPKNAAKLFSLVQKHGARQTKIVIVN